MAMEVVFKGSGPSGPRGGIDGNEQKRELNGEEEDNFDKAGSGRSSSELHGSKPSSPDQADSAISNCKQASPKILTDISSMDATSRPSSSNLKDSFASKQNQLESAKAQMGEVKEENERLKMILARIMKDYQSLQMQFHDVVQQEQDKNSTESASNNMDIEEPEFVSLSLGTAPSRPKKEEVAPEASTKVKDDGKPKEDLTLGLDCRFEKTKNDPTEPPKSQSPDNSFEEAKDEEVGEPWPPSKVLKTLRSGDDEMSQQAQVKKARVSVRARCETPTMHDGCQWRKYGQKIAKGNPCPRAYYRCTVSAGCPVRKQVQRCADDMSILITTYEGTHNHPLPISATAMASTTSAAACMLLSGSSTSRQSIGNSSSATTTSADLHGLNFNLSDNSRSRPFYFSNHSISSSPSYPTITLDLTAPASSSSQFNRFSTSFPSAPRFSSTSFNFASTPWSSDNSYLNYSAAQPYNKSQIGPFSLGTAQPLEHFYQPNLQKNTTSTPVTPPPPALSETIAAATKVLTSDPNFRSALVAAITSIVGNNGATNGSHGGGDTLGHTLKWGEQFQTVPPFSVPAANSCVPSFLNRSSSTSSPQPGNFMFLPPSLPFSSAKSASTSPVDNREHTN